MDDTGEAKLNGASIGSVWYTGKGDWVDITQNMTPGDNTLYLKDYNDGGGYTWGFSVEYNGNVIWDDHAGTVGSWGANNDDRSRSRQLVYEKTLVLHSDGTISDTASGASQGINPQVTDPSTAIKVGSTVEVIAIEYNIRPAPGTDNTPITKVKEGARLKVIDGPVWVDTTSDNGQPMQRDWWQVSGWDTYGSLGWCSSLYLQVVP